ncbi:MAG: hypothetical protein LC634_06290 [Sphingomonadales bacterium]|nr:hypothetical protein [Sphingomonadales bacterium]
MTGIKIEWRAAIWAGLIAGLVFLVLEMTLVATIGGGSPWGPPRMMAAMVMGKGVLPPPATFDMTIVMVAMAVHFFLSVALAAIFGLLVGMFSRTLPIMLGLGLVFGLGVYAIDFYLFTGLFPWFAMARNAITLLSHAVFGIVIGWVYHQLGSDRHQSTSSEID